MTEDLALILSVAFFSSAISFFIAKKWNESHYAIYVAKAKAKAKAIEKESNLMINLTKSKADKEILDYKQKCKKRKFSN